MVQGMAAMLATTVLIGSVLTKTDGARLEHRADQKISGKTKVMTHCFLEPCVIHGDFNGDGRSDSATLVKNKSGKSGILFELSQGGMFLIGAGTGFGNGSDDFSWMVRWALVKGPSLPNPRADSILAESAESGGGLIYWTGSFFRWRQQGD